MEQNELKEQLNRIESYAMLGAKQVLTLEDAVILTGLSKGRLYTLTSKQEIPHYKKGKIYFKRDELEKWLTSKRVPTMAELQSKAVKHCLEH